MEVSVPCHKTASQESSSNSVSATTPNITTHYRLGDLSMNDLKMCLNEFLSIENIGTSTSSLPVGKTNKFDVIEDECKDSDETIGKLPESTSSVEEMFQEKGRDGYKISEVNDCGGSVDQSYQPPRSSSTPSKLVSAMKGSREKKGIKPEKLSVTWAPDVYDPVPTSVSHFPSNKNQQYRNNGRKYGKNKRRGGGGGNSSRGGKGKDKKQGRKNGGNPTKSKPVDNSVANFSEAKAEAEVGIIDFNVVSADPFCGSSFLKESVNNLHFPVAEATR